MNYGNEGTKFPKNAYKILKPIIDIGRVCIDRLLFYKNEI